MPSLFGIPVIVLGGVCLGLTIVWVFVWPRGRVTPADGMRYLIVRWFHALVWLLLALAAFVAGLELFGGLALAQPLALLALFVYFVYMFTLLTSRQRA